MGVGWEGGAILCHAVLVKIIYNLRLLGKSNFYFVIIKRSAYFGILKQSASAKKSLFGVQEKFAMYNAKWSLYFNFIFFN